MSNGITEFPHLDEVALHCRSILDEGIPQKDDKPNKFINHILMFAYNGTGKTRLSMAFKDLGKTAKSKCFTAGGSNAGEPLEREAIVGDTLYFNAYTEDLFTWDNDLDNDAQRVLRINKDSKFFEGLQALEMENRIRPLLERYADFNFKIDYENWAIHFSRERTGGSTMVEVPENGAIEFNPNGFTDDIKVSRGEENIFIWCFFLAVAQIAINAEEGETYHWVKYIYIDDPVSSLDDNNAITVASHLSQLLMSDNKRVKTVISTHHTLFFNVMWNELNKKRKLQPYFLSCNKSDSTYSLRFTSDTPFFHHVALLKQLVEAAETDKLYTYHFNILRSLLEKTATFHGFKNFSACIKKSSDDPNGVVHARIVNVLSHGNYSLFEPREMLEENKQHFKQILNTFMDNYRFNPELFPARDETAA